LVYIKFIYTIKNLKGGLNKLNYFTLNLNSDIDIAYSLKNNYHIHIIDDLKNNFNCELNKFKPEELKNNIFSAMEKIKEEIDDSAIVDFDILLGTTESEDFIDDFIRAAHEYIFDCVYFSFYFNKNCTIEEKIDEVFSNNVKELLKDKYNKTKKFIRLKKIQ
jgi:hypothetical protein